LALRQRSAVTLAAVVVFATAGAACNAVLGLDAPRLDPCAASECVDGTAPSSQDAGPAAVDGAVSSDADAAFPDADAAPDTGPLIGIRCGGGSSPAIGCGADSPVCCLVLDAGAASYTCDEDASACSGYPILCATNNDCAGSDVCCHYGSAITCVGETVCPNNSLVCDPAGPSDQCPAGWQCSVAFVNGSYTLPYYGCTP
jgi:hypothetical protein